MEEAAERQTALARMEARRLVLEGSIDSAATAKAKPVPEKELSKLDVAKRQKYEEQLLLQSKRAEMERELQSVSAVRIQFRFLKEFPAEPNRSLANRVLETLGFSQEKLSQNRQESLENSTGASSDIWSNGFRCKVRRFWLPNQVQSNPSVSAFDIAASSIVSWLYSVFVPSQDRSDSDPLWVPQPRLRSYISKPAARSSSTNVQKFRLVERFEIGKRLKSEVARTSLAVTIPAPPRTFIYIYVISDQ